MTDFHTEARKLGIEILGAESFVGDPKSQVDNIKVTQLFSAILSLLLFHTDIPFLAASITK